MGFAAGGVGVCGACFVEYPPYFIFVDCTKCFGYVRGHMFLYFIFGRLVLYLEDCVRCRSFCIVGRLVIVRDEVRDRR